MKTSLKITALTLLALPFVLGMQVAAQTTAAANVATLSIYYEDGTPAARLGVTLYNAVSGTQHGGGTTNENGAVRFEGIDSQYSYVAVIGGYGKYLVERPGEFKFTVARKKPVTQQMVTLPNPQIALLTILVQDATTKAQISSARVTVYSKDGFELANLVSDQKGGLFEVKVAADSEATVVVYAPGYYPKKEQVKTSAGRVVIELAPEQKVICIEDYQYLKRGDTSDDVRNLQEKLKSAGLLKIDRTTTYYGPATEAAKKLAESSGRIVPCYKPTPTEPTRPAPIPSNPIPDPTNLRGKIAELHAAISQLQQLVERLLKIVDGLGQ